MTIKSNYVFYFFNKLSPLILLWIVFYIFKIKDATHIILLYGILDSAYYFIFNKGVAIENDYIAIVSSETEKYYFDEITKVVFKQQYYLICSFQKIEIWFSDGRKKVIGCNGINSDDEYEDSFYQIFNYTKRVFENTYLIENGRMIN